MNKVKVMIADDQEILLEGMKLLLSSTGKMDVTTVKDAEKVTPEYFVSKPDVLVCDIRFTNGNGKTGLDILSDIISSDPTAKIIMHSQFEEGELIRGAYQRGAKAFLSKAADLDAMIDIITRVHDGETVVPNDTAQTLAHFTIENKASKNNVFSELSPRQLTIFKLVAMGLTQDQIATEVDLSKRTVTAETKKIKAALDIEKSSEFTLLALKHELLNPTDIKSA